jgi:chromosomal replication initiation ATPase DnaA
MDNQQLFNLVVSVAGGLAVYVINNMTRNIQRLEDKVNELPHTYVAKDEYRSDIAEVKSILKQIFDKLDGKADKQ